VILTAEIVDNCALERRAKALMNRKTANPMPHIPDMTACWVDAFNFNPPKGAFWDEAPLHCAGPYQLRRFDA